MMVRPLARSRRQAREARARSRGRSLGESLGLLAWLVMMLVWLVAWVLGVWWVLPIVAQLELNFDVIGGLFWLVTGAVAWIVAFLMGHRRFWAG